MNESLNNLTTIRQYLLGKISDETMLEGIEEMLFADDDFCTRTEIVEDELVNDFIFGKLNAEDSLSFEKTLETNSDRRAKVKVTQLLKEKTAPQVVEEKTSFFDSFKAFFRQPIYAGGFALLLVAILIGAILLSRSPNNSELAELKNIYQKNRPIESRISEFDYAPYEVTRGENDLSDAERRKLKIIENDLLKKVDNSPTANNQNALGIFYLSQRKYSEAIKELEKSVKLEPNNAKFHNNLGSAYFESAKNGESGKKFINLNQANEGFAKALELNPNLLDALFNKSLSLQEIGLFAEAKKSWELYLQKDSTSKWADEARKNLEKISNIQSDLNRKKEDILNDFLTAYRNKDEKTVWKIHNSTKGTLTNIALAEQLTNRFLEARQNKDDTAAQESIEALTYIGNLEKEKHADFFFADLADFYAKLPSAKIESLIKAKKLMRDGFALMSKQKSDNASVSFEASKPLFLESSNQIESNLAELFSSQMLIYTPQIKESSVRMKKLLDYATNRNYKILEANLLYWIGISDARQSEFSQAIRRIKKALEIGEKTTNIYSLRQSSSDLAVIYSNLGESTKALEQITKTINDENSFYVNKTQTQNTLNSATELLSKLGNNLTAIDFAKESVEINKARNDNETINVALRYLSNALAQSKKFNEALEVSNQSNELALKLEQTSVNQKKVADTFLVRADLKREMNLCEESLQDYEKSAEFYNNQTATNYNLYNIEKGKLLCLKQLGRTVELQSQLEKVLSLSEENRKNIKDDNLRQGFFENEQIVFDLAVENSINKQEARQAFEFAETARARSLLDFVKSEKSIAEVENDFGSLAKPYSLEQIRAKIPENVQILEYSVLPDKIAIWLITNNKFELTEKPINNEEFEQKINKYRNLIIQKNNISTLKQNAQELYQLLIPNNLEKEKTICLIPDKSLHQIPFASLISNEEKYLIEDFAILYSPSSSVFVTLTEKAKSKIQEERLLSIGNPKFDRTENLNLSDLPEAEFEAKEIAKNYPDNRKFIGEEATKENFLANFESAEIIHFAGHFVSNKETTSNSRMLFSVADLFSFELSEKKLPQSKLVVLSACETGLEKVNSGEGAIGVARTFLALGTPLVVASNWKVDSVATKDLMISFHKKRIPEKKSTVEALRQSQLEMLKTQEFSAPFYWSSFSATGGLTVY